jgi:hypothetical protein
MIGPTASSISARRVGAWDGCRPITCCSTALPASLGDGSTKRREGRRPRPVSVRTSRHRSIVWAGSPAAASKPCRSDRTGLDGSNICTTISARCRRPVSLPRISRASGKPIAPVARVLMSCALACPTSSAPRLASTRPMRKCRCRSCCLVGRLLSRRSWWLWLGRE